MGVPTRSKLFRGKYVHIDVARSTQALPKDIRIFGDIDGVWVTNYVCFYSLAVAMQQKIIELASTRSMVAGKNEKADILFHYLTGVEFASGLRQLPGRFPI